MRDAPLVPVRATLGCRTNPLHARPIISDRMLHVKTVEIDIDILFRAHVVGVFNCRAQQLFNFRRNPLFVERQRVQRIFHAPALNEFQHQARLLRRHANKSGLSSEFHFLISAIWLSAFSS
jgi:hypothetical protein